MNFSSMVIRFILLLFCACSFQACLEDEDGDFSMEDPEGNQIINGIEVGPCFEETIGLCADLSFHPVMVYLSLNSCDAYCIMEMYQADCPQDVNINGEFLAPEDYLEYFYDNPDLGVDSVIATNVLIHESMHHLVNIDPSDNNDNIILDCNQSWLVNRTNTFPSIELMSQIDELFRTPRFDGYINTNASHTTQLNGIYGLLNEFSSYYQGSKALADIAIKKEALDNILYVLNSCTPYYEFKFWILQYLIYAEQFEEAIFQDIMANEAFKESFLAIEVAYADLVFEMSTAIDPLEQSGMDKVKNVAEKMESLDFTLMLESLRN